MASQPRLAHVLLLGLVAGWLRAAQPRDFTVKDIVYLHPSRVLVELSLPSVPRKNLSFQNSVEFCAGKMKFPYGYACNHNLQATPFPHGFKCFTCERAADNYECNRWAPDVYCPRGTRYCFSQHMMRVTGESVSVTKRCVPLEDCLSTGCTYVKHEEYKICTSCCEGTICNLPLPRNASDAVFTTLSPLSSTPGLSGRAVLMAACLLLGFLV